MTHTQHIEAAAITLDHARELARRIDNGYQMSKFAHMEDLRTEQKADSMRATDAIRSLADRVEALTAERDSAIVAAKYAEHIDATPENQLQTMLYDTLKERDAAMALAAARLVDAERYRWLRDSAGNEILVRLQEILISDEWDDNVDAARQAAMDAS